jgi:hypothetical protein
LKERGYSGTSGPLGHDRITRISIVVKDIVVMPLNTIIIHLILGLYRLLFPCRVGRVGRVS